MKPTVILTAALLAALLAGSAVAGPALTADKTLVSWVCLANTTQHEGQGKC